MPEPYTSYNAMASWEVEISTVLVPCAHLAKKVFPNLRIKQETSW